MWRYIFRLKAISALNSPMKEKRGDFAFLDRKVLVSLKRVKK
jgi:hypothetical protein